MIVLLLCGVFMYMYVFFFFKGEEGIGGKRVTEVQGCPLPISPLPQVRPNNRRRQPTLSTKSPPPNQKRQRNRHEQRSNTPQQGAGPLDPEVLEHLRGEEREDGADAGSHHGVCGEGGGGAKRGLVNIFIYPIMDCEREEEVTIEGRCREGS